jgi:hypothetical protein
MANAKSVSEHRVKDRDPLTLTAETIYESKYLMLNISDWLGSCDKASLRYCRLDGAGDGHVTNIKQP